MFIPNSFKHEAATLQASDPVCVSDSEKGCGTKLASARIIGSKAQVNCPHLELLNKKRNEHYTQFVMPPQSQSVYQM